MSSSVPLFAASFRSESPDFDDDAVTPATNEELQLQIEGLKSRINDLKDENMALQKENDELKRELPFPSLQYSTDRKTIELAQELVEFFSLEELCDRIYSGRIRTYFEDMKDTKRVALFLLTPQKKKYGIFLRPKDIEKRRAEMAETGVIPEPPVRKALREEAEAERRRQNQQMVENRRINASIRAREAKANRSGKKGKAKKAASDSEEEFTGDSSEDDENMEVDVEEEEEQAEVEQEAVRRGASSGRVAEDATDGKQPARKRARPTTARAKSVSSKTAKPRKSQAAPKASSAAPPPPTVATTRTRRVLSKEPNYKETPLDQL